MTETNCKFKIGDKVSAFLGSAIIEVNEFGKGFPDMLPVYNKTGVIKSIGIMTWSKAKKEMILVDFDDGGEGLFFPEELKYAAKHIETT